MKTQRRSKQEGSLYEDHGAWYVRYREHGGKNPVAHRLASREDYPKRSEVIPLKKEFMERVNRTANLPNAGVTIVDFFENVYLPAITGRLKRSTVNRVQGFLALPYQRSSEGQGQGLPDGGW